MRQPPKFQRRTERTGTPEPIDNPPVAAPLRRAYLLSMRWFRRTLLALVALLAGPLVVLVGGDVLGSDWRTASREPAKIAPDPLTTSEAIVHVYAARTFSWRGAFGVHTWISVKPTAAPTYTVYEVIGWRGYGGHSVLTIHNGVPDRYWFGRRPQLIAEIRGKGGDDIIRKIDRAARRYPYQHTYKVYPGPNSNTFTAWVARHVPEMRLDLPPTAIGKDYLGDTLVSEAPSGTGYQFNVKGLFGVLAAVEEGLEINVAGLTFGIDPLNLAIKLPGIGRLGILPQVARSD